INRGLFFPAPQLASPNAAASPSFSIATDTWKMRSRSFTGFSPFHVGKKLTSPISPENGSIGPVEPMPIPVIFACALADASRNICAVRSSALLYPKSADVADSNREWTRPSLSTIPTAIFVPPMSTPAIIASTPRSPRRTVRSPSANWSHPWQSLSDRPPRSGTRCARESRNAQLPSALQNCDLPRPRSRELFHRVRTARPVGCPPETRVSPPPNRGKRHTNGVCLPACQTPPVLPPDNVPVGSAQQRLARTNLIRNQRRMAVLVHGNHLAAAHFQQ